MQFVDEFPMTVTGKVQKFKLREQAIEELGLAGPRRGDRLTAKSVGIAASARIRCGDAVAERRRGT